MTIAPPKGIKLKDWDKNPWYGGTIDKKKPKDFGEHPTPQTHIERRLDEGARHLPPMTSKVKLPMVTLA